MKQMLLPVFVSLLMAHTCQGQAATISHSDDIHTSRLPDGDTVSSMSNNIMLIFEDSRHHYWFGSWTDGLFRRDTAGNIIHYTANTGLPNNSIRAINQDKSGHVYFTTEGGISKYDGKQFFTLPEAPPNHPNHGWKSEPDDLWFKNPNTAGLYRYDGTWLYPLAFPKHYMHDAHAELFLHKRYKPYDVYYIFEDRRGDLWFGTGNFGLCRYDGKSLQWMYEDHHTYVPQGGMFGIRSIFEDRAGKFWICNTRYRYDVDRNPGIHRDSSGTPLLSYRRAPGMTDIVDLDGADHVYFMSMVEDDEGDLWMATYGSGVWRYDPGTNTTKSFHVVKDGEMITLYSIYKDSKGVLWLGTHENGVWKWNGNNFERFN